MNTIKKKIGKSCIAGAIAISSLFSGCNTLSKMYFLNDLNVGLTTEGFMEDKLGVNSNKGTRGLIQDSGHNATGNYYSPIFIRRAELGGSEVVLEKRIMSEKESEAILCKGFYDSNNNGILEENEIIGKGNNFYLGDDFTFLYSFNNRPRKVSADIYIINEKLTKIAELNYPLSKEDKSIVLRVAPFYDGLYTIELKLDNINRSIFANINVRPKKDDQ